MQTKLFSNLSGDLTGAPDRRPPLVLLHGLTFDRTMWHPALAHLAELDPGRQVLALDLPGHGDWDPAASRSSAPAGSHRAYSLVVGTEPYRSVSLC